MKAKFTTMLIASLFALAACKPAGPSEITAEEWKTKADSYEKADVASCTVNYHFSDEEQGSFAFTHNAESGSWGTGATTPEQRTTLMKIFQTVNVGTHCSEFNPNNYLYSVYNPEIHYWSDLSVSGSYTVDNRDDDTADFQMYDSETIKFSFDSRGYLSRYEATGTMIISGISEEDAAIFEMLFGYKNGTTNINTTIDFVYSA